MSGLARALPRPDSVALVGASDGPEKTTPRPLAFPGADRTQTAPGPDGGTT